MTLKSFRNNFILVCACFFLFTLAAYSQTDTAIKKNDVKAESDSIAAKLDRLREIGEKAIQQVVSENKEKQINSRQLIILDELEKEINKVNEYFKRGIDTVSINQEIKFIEEQLKIANEGIFTGEIEVQTLRNLNTSSILINEILTRLNQNKKKTESILADLNPLRNVIDSLESDTIIFKFAKDTALFKGYLGRLNKLLKVLGPTDSSLTATIKNLRETENYMVNLSGNINTRLELINGYKESAIDKVFLSERKNIYEPEESKESIDAKVNYSYVKANMVLNYYLRNNFGKVILAFILFFALIYFTYKIRNQYYPDNISGLNETAQSVFAHPFLSTAFLSLTVLQFIFPHPPVIFYGLIWILSSVILTLILWKHLSGSERIYWLYLFTAFVFTLTIDLMLKVSLIERWFMIFIALSGIVVTISAYRNNVVLLKNKNVRFILFAIILLLLSGGLISNLSGKYNLSKVLITTSIFGALTAFLLTWSMIFFTELFNVASETYKSEGNENFQSKLNKYKLRFPVYLKFILFAGWLLLVARNLYFYDLLESEFISFITEETEIGNFSFSLEKLMLFIFIIFISAIISKAISFYADKADNSSKASLRDSSNSGGLSNWMLLIRIGVISIGTLLAFAATGLPIDKLTIIIGSLGVGIGLGMQSVVNNLVSGIMLAFEKPFKIGDYIEIGDEAGRIKEIGIRSSKLSTAEGADIIIPNGDLLSKHVINWTLRNSQKRSELILNINYGNKLNEIKTIFKNIMNRNENIEKYPEPEVLMHKFSGGTAEYRLLYWTYIDQEDQVKSELIVSVDEELKAAGVDLSS